MILGAEMADQLIGVEGFEEHRQPPVLDLGIHVIGQGRDHDHLQVRLVLGGALGEQPPVLRSQPDIGDEHVRRVAGEVRERARERVFGLYRIAFVPQKGTERLHESQVVVYQDDFARGHACHGITPAVPVLEG